MNVLAEPVVEHVRFWDSIYNTSQRTRYRVDTRFISEPGALRYVPAVADEFGSRVLAFIDASLAGNAGVHATIAELGRSCDVQIFEKAQGEPTEEDLIRAVQAVRTSQPEWLLAVGGGSTLDLCKAASVFAHVSYPDEPLSSRLANSATTRTPVVAVPTTVGTGSEVSRYVVISNTDANRKSGYRSWSFSPRVALIDSNLYESLPRSPLVLGVIDAAVHLYETFVCRTEHSAPIDLLCLDGLTAILENVPGAAAGDRSPERMLPLGMAATYGGIAISNVRLGIIHRAGEALAGIVRMPHGHSLALFLSQALRADAPFVRDRWERARPHLCTLGSSPSGFYDAFAPLLSEISALGLDRLNAEELAGGRFESVARAVTDEVCSDAVLFKESPRPIDPDEIGRFVRACLKDATGLEAH